MSQSPAALVRAKDLDVFTPHGRKLFEGLNVEISNDQVAMIGRNGVGKTTLLKILAGEMDRPEVGLNTVPAFVPQHLGNANEIISQARDTLHPNELIAAGLDPAVLTQATCSPGEQRKLHLLAAKKQRPELLILDEPTSDLDEPGIEWLLGWLTTWSRGLLLVSHNRLLLRQFQHFFVIAESGCRYLSGGLDRVESFLASEANRNQQRYVSNLQSLSRQEEKNERVNSRHDRKRNRGRLNELGRCPSRAKLNEKRSYAQVKQGRRKKLWKTRISASREWTKAMRRALSVRLELPLIAPKQPIGTPNVVVEANGLAAVIDHRDVFSNVSIRVQCSDRIAVKGRNGAGKTTLLNLLAGQRAPDRGHIEGDFSRIGMIAQGACNWQSRLGLMANLHASCDSSIEEVADILASHRFPFGLAQRPLKSLSPGERVRAALICLYHRSPVVECLMLDEPTVGLDFVGQSAVRDALKSWSGALVVVSHDRDFLDSIDIRREVHLDA